MLAHEQAEVSLPNSVAFMIQRGQNVMIRFIPHYINAVAIHCRSGGGVAIKLVSRKGINAKSRFHCTFPSFALRQSTDRPPDLSPVQVTKIRPPHRTGEEWPLP